MSSTDRSEEIGFLMAKVEDIERVLQNLDKNLRQHMLDEAKDQKKLYLFILGIYAVVIFANSDKVTLLIKLLERAI